MSSLVELQATADADLTQLGRVSHRLAVTDDGPPLERVLAVLLPRLLSRIGKNHRTTLDLRQSHASPSLDVAPAVAAIQRTYDKIHAKLVEMLSHAMKRVRADRTCRVPCAAVLGLLYDAQTKTASGPSDVDAFTLNLSLAFLTLGLDRCTVEEAEGLLPGLVALLGKHSGIDSLLSAARKSQRNQIAHLILRSIEAIVSGNRGGGGSAANGASSTAAAGSSGSASQLLSGKKAESSTGRKTTTPSDDAREAVASDDAAGAAVYDLLLDVLLYQTTGGNSNIPPAGLSQAGHERLLAGASATAPKWGAEFAAVTRLRDLKLAVLAFVVPTRRWALFMGGDEVGKGSSNSSAAGKGAGVGVGTARTVALLAVASGDAHYDVEERASGYLKAHMDSLRNVTRGGQNNANGEAPPSDDAVVASPGNDGGEREMEPSAGTSDLVHPLLGDPIKLAIGLLSLVLGESVAENAILTAAGAVSVDPAFARLGTTAMRLDGSSPETVRAAVMSTKRRMITEKTATAVLAFVAGRVLDDIPRIFEYPLDLSAAVSSGEQGGFVASASILSSLIVASASYYLGSSQGSAGLASGGSGSGRVRLSAAKVLNSLAVRLVALYDAIVAPPSSSSPTTMQQKAAASISIIHDHLARVFALSCRVLAASASRHTAISGNEKAVEAKDSCYGVMCTIARSAAASSSSGMVFNLGETKTAASDATATAVSNRLGAVSIKTAALLFGCASHEEEHLRPRATAALDALLSAYCRVYTSDREHSSTQAAVVPMEVDDEPENPWGQQQQQQPSADKRGIAQQSSSTNFDALARSLLPLLWSSARPSQPKASRLASARWANDLVRPINLCNACHILCFLAGDADVTASSVAREGLGLASLGSDQDVTALAAEVGENEGLPDFQEFVDAVFSDTVESSSLGVYRDFSPGGQGATLRFGLMCLLADLYGGEDQAVATYMGAITTSLSDLNAVSSSERGTGRGREALDLLDDCCFCMAGVLGTSSYARVAIAKSQGVNCQYLANLAITAASSKARRLLAESCGYLYEDKSIWGCDWAEASGISKSLSLCASKLKDMRQTLFMAGEGHGAAHLGSRCVRAFRLHAIIETADADDGTRPCWNASAEIISALGHGTLHSDDAIGNASSQGLVIAFSYDQVDAPALDERLYTGTTKAFQDVVVALKKYGNGDKTDPQRATLLAKAAGVMLAASTSSSGTAADKKDDDDTPSLGSLRLQCVESIFALFGSMSYRKDQEISLVAGEALAAYADAYSPEGSEWSSPNVAEPEEYDEAFAKELPPHKHVVYVMLKSITVATNPHKRTASAPAMLALVARAAAMVNKNSAYASRHFVAEIMRSLPEFQTAFVKLLADPKNKQLGRESACLGLAACHGLASATAMSGDDALKLNERLLNAFGATTNHGGSAMQETAAENRERVRQENRDGDAGVGAAAALMEDFGMERTEVGGASGLGEASLGSFREMAAAAVALERPDILYSLMLLSTTHPVWKTPEFRHRYNANTLLGEAASDSGRNILEIQTALRPHLGKLIPRLLRACNDPRKDTREQMTALWIGLTGGGADARAAISDHLHTTLDALINDATNKLWRARVGACGALADVIVGRSWAELGGGPSCMDDDDRSASGSSVTAAVRLLRLLRVTTRSLDDVRLTVRESGEVLGRSVRALIIRLCDPSADAASNEDVFQSDRVIRNAQLEADAQAAAATALRWLVKHGLNQPSAEATGLCVSTLLGIVDVAKHSTLQPVLPDLIYSLLMAMSGLEPAALNYLQTRAAGRDSDGAPGATGYDQLEKLRLQIAQSGPIAGALTKCLGMIRFFDVDEQSKIIPYFDGALRAGAGFATRAAVADAVTSLCSTSPSAFKISGHSSTNPTVRLLRALYFASEREKGAGARDKMAHALGSLAELSPGHAVRVLALRACERYSTSLGGTSNDPAARRAAAAALRSIAVRASNQFSDGGTNDIWCKRVLPLAFLGRKDDDKKIASLWNEVWEEGGTVANAGGGGQDFGVILEERLLPSLVRTCMEALGDVSWSRRATACETLIDLADLNVLSPAPRSLKRNTESASKPSSVTRERRRAQASAEVLTTCTRLIGKSRLWAGKDELVKATAKIASKWSILGAIDETTDWTVFGSEENGKCDWVPIRQEDMANDWDNLFVGDKWFKGSSASPSTTLEEEKSTKDNTSAPMDSELEATGSSNEEESDLDFGDEDKVVGSEKFLVSTSDVTDDEAERPARYDALTVSGLCRLLLEQGLPSAKTSVIDNDVLLPYRAAALKALSDLLHSMQPVSSAGKPPAASIHEKYIYSKIAPILISEVRTTDTVTSAAPKEKPQPPLITARCLGCLSAVLWHGIGERDDAADDEDVVALSKILNELCGGKQPAWTVREASALTACSLAERAAPNRIRKHSVITTLLDCTVQTQKDRKFWRVRLAGLKLLLALVRRAGTSSDASGPVGGKVSSDASGRQLILEAILPEKEKIQKMARASLNDNEAKVTAVATEICGALCWWP